MNTTCNVALAGYGYAGKTFHAPLITATPGMTLHAIASGRPDAVHADYPHVRVTDYATLLRDPDIDLVVIASPNDAHFAQARDALLAGKHVVVDKPFTTTLDEALQLAALADTQQRLLSVFHNRRWDADFLGLRQLIKAGTLGRISHVSSRFDRFRPHTRQRWREEDRPGAGLWFDLGPHLVDQVLQLFGLPVSVHGTLLRQREGARIDDCFDVRLRYPDFMVNLHGGCLVPGGSPRFTVHGDKASFVKHGLDPQEDALKAGTRPGSEGWGIDPVPATLWQADADQPHPVTLAMPAGDHGAYYRAILSAMRGEGPNPVTALEAARVMHLIERVALSHREGRDLPVDQEGLA